MSEGRSGVCAIFGANDAKAAQDSQLGGASPLRRGRATQEQPPLSLLRAKRGQTCPAGSRPQIRDTKPELQSRNAPLDNMNVRVAISYSVILEVLLYLNDVLEYRS
jgi:hypothetical protein